MTSPMYKKLHDKGRENTPTRYNLDTLYDLYSFVFVLCSRHEEGSSFMTVQPLMGLHPVLHTSIGGSGSVGSGRYFLVTISLNCTTR